MCRALGAPSRFCFSNFSTRVFGFLNGFFVFFTFGFSPVFPSFSTKKMFEKQIAQKNAFSCFFSFRESHGFASVRGTVLLLRESRPCLSETKKNMFYVFFFSRESRFCFRERHGCAFARVTAVPLGNEKTCSLFFIPSARGTVVLSREARPCLTETEKTRFLFFLS